MKLRALQRNELERQKSISDISLLTSDMFIFVDETGADNRNTIRRYGYSMRGKPPVNHQLFARGERISAIACMASCGILDAKLIKGTTDGDIFYEFVKTHLPHLMPFNGLNPHSVVVLDNCSVHHVPETTGALVMFLPPYSPDFNPIEEYFSKII